MDIPRTNVPSPRALAWRRVIVSGVLLLTIVFTVASLPVVFLYFAAADEQTGGPFSESAAPTEPPPQEDTAFVDVSVLGANGIEPRQIIVVRDGRIVRVGQSRDAVIPAGVRRIDGDGRVLVAD